MEKKRRKRLLPYVLAVMMVLTAIPFILGAQATANAASSSVAEGPYDIYVGGIKVTDENKDHILGADDTSVKYDPATATLTLKDANISVAPGTDAHDRFVYSGIAVIENWDYEEQEPDDPVTINLEGTNTISGSGIGAVTDSYNDEVCGICSWYNTDITGTGSLEVNIETKKGFGGDLYGLYSIGDGALTVGPKVALDITLTELFVPDNNPLPENTRVCGVFASHGIDITGSDINVDITTIDAGAAGLSGRGPFRITDHADVDLTLSGTQSGVPGWQTGIQNNSYDERTLLTIDDSDVDIVVGKPGTKSYYAKGIYSAFSITGTSKVKVAAGEPNGTSYPYYSYGIVYSASSAEAEAKKVLFTVSDTAVLEVSGYTCSVKLNGYTSNSDSSTSHCFLDVSGHEYGAYGKALVSDSVTGENAQLWKPYVPGEGTYLDAHRYAKIPAYSADDMVTVTINAGGKPGVLKQTNYRVLKGTQWKDVFIELQNYIDDEQYQLDTYLYDGSVTGTNLKTGNTDLIVGVSPSYSDKTEYRNDMYGLNGQTINDDATVYLFWCQPISSAAFSVSSPDPADNANENPPVFKSLDNKVSVTGSLWVADDAVYNGPIVDGSTYTAVAYIMPGFGYYLTDDCKVTVEGGTNAQIMMDGSYAYVLADVKAGLRESQIHADAFADMANALPNVSKITLSSESAVKAARAAYNKLTAQEKSLVSAAALKKLTDAEAKISQLKAKATYDKNVKAAKAYKVSGLKAKSKAARKASVNWKANKKASGYRIAYSTNKKFKKAKMKTVKGASKKSAVLKKLKSKKTYYVRIQTYKTLKNPLTKKTVKIYGKWSAKKAVKIK